MLPTITVFRFALDNGLGAYFAALGTRETLSALKLTLIAVLVAVPINVVFGIAAAWAITRFNFRGKGTLIAIIDLPFAVSPVVADLVFVLLFGARGPFGP